MSKIEVLKDLLQNDRTFKEKICKELGYKVSWLYKILNGNIKVTSTVFDKICEVIEKNDLMFSKRVDLPPVNAEKYMRKYNCGLLTMMVNGTATDELINEQEKVQMFINENYSN